jgi:probable rRNA maturation factor
VAGLEYFAGKALNECLKLRQGQATELTKLREISVVLVSDRRMSQLHRQFLHRGGPTDVLTFEHGEIFLSVPTAARNARRFGNSLVREMQLYIIHGLLHLHGFDDRTGDGAREMEKMQAKILARLG